MFTRTILFCAALAANTLAHGADSDIDTSFGIFSTGHNVVPINGGGGNGDTVADVLVAPDSSLFLVGTSDLAGGQSRITVVHLLANGQLDTNFGTNGHYVVPSVSATASSAAFAANGDILVGATRHTAGNDDFTVCRVRGAGWRSSATPACLASRSPSTSVARCRTPRATSSCLPAVASH